MGDYKIKLSISGFNELRNQPLVKADLIARGTALAAACGPGYEVEDSSDKKRARVTVWPDTVDARIDETQHNNLIRNLDAAR